MITELKEIDKPLSFWSTVPNPYSDESQALCRRLQERYHVPVVAVNCLELSEEEIKNILQKVLYQFPVKEIKVDMPQMALQFGKRTLAAFCGIHFYQAIGKSHLQGRSGRRYSYSSDVL